MNREEIDRTIQTWEELRKCYKEEIDMGKDVELNTFLFLNSKKEIKKLKALTV